MKCKWLSDDFSEVCTNVDCDYLADFCPCTEFPNVCRHSELVEDGWVNAAITRRWMSLWRGIWTRVAAESSTMPHRDGEGCGIGCGDRPEKG